MYNEVDVDWAPTLALGHRKKFSLETPERGARRKELQANKDRVEAASSLLTLFSNSTSNEPEDEDQLPKHLPEPEPALGKAVQTDLRKNILSSMKSELNRLTVETVNMKNTLESAKICVNMFEGNDEKVRLYTGLPSYSILMVVYSFIEAFLSQTHSSSLTSANDVSAYEVKTEFACAILG